MGIKTRDEISKKYKWRLEDIYCSTDKWNDDFNKAESLCSEVSELKGTLSQGADALLKVIKKMEELYLVTEKLFVYARMKRDEDNSVSEAQGLTDRAMGLWSRAMAAASYVAPEILELDEEQVMNWVNTNEDMQLYTQYFNELFRQKPHTLSKNEEELLAMSSEMGSGAKNIFTMLNNADLKFGEITDEAGNKVELTKGNFISFMESQDRGVRKGTFNEMYRVYGNYRNTISASLTASVKSSIFYAKVRKYNSSLEKALDADNVELAVYDNLIKAIGGKLPLLDRYLDLRKKVLGVDSLHMYDLYVPLVEESQEKIPYEKATEMVMEGLGALGNEYVELLEKGFNSGWIDVYENRGKTGGAYSWGAYTTHPYVLLNYQGKINDVFTIAHEMGHALHTYYSNKTQPFIYADYKIFVAEVASTVNEILLMKHLLSKSTVKQERAYLLNHFLEEFRGTVFRQTMFAEFEKLIHGRSEAGEPLTAEALSEIYYGLNEKFFGRKVEVDKEIALEWARIPHFYNSFYVYKYATGFSAASAIAKQVLEEGEPAVKRYKEFLSGGSSDYPLELLKKAGVDLTEPKPIYDALDVFEETLTELENLLV